MYAVTIVAGGNAMFIVGATRKLEHMTSWGSTLQNGVGALCEMRQPPAPPGAAPARILVAACHSLGRGTTESPSGRIGLLGCGGQFDVDLHTRGLATTSSIII